MRKIYWLLAFSIFLSYQGCEKILLGDTIEDNPINNFEYIWSEYRDHYGTFDVKEIDWSGIYDIYRPEVTELSTDIELLEVLTNMLEELDDSHIAIWDVSNDEISKNTGIYGKFIEAGFYDISLDLIRSRYLQEELFHDTEAQITYGWLSDQIGYLWLGDMFDNLEFWKDKMNEVISTLQNSDGIILDIRDNGGGEDEVSRLIASFFAVEEKPYQQARFKVGPDPDDFDEPRIWTVAPNDVNNYSGRVILLTDRYTISAAETFSLAMRTIDQVTHVGDTTTGAFSDTVIRELPNGWYFTLPIADIRDHDGKSWESIGLGPDILIQGSPELIDAGNDIMLEKALELLQ